MPPLHLAVYDAVLGNGDLVASELSSRQGSPNASNGFFKHVSSEALLSLIDGDPGSFRPENPRDLALVLALYEVDLSDQAWIPLARAEVATKALSPSRSTPAKP